MIVVDGSVWIDFLNGHNAAHVRELRLVLGTDEIIVGDLMLCEVLQGLDSERSAREVERLLRRFQIVPAADQQRGDALTTLKQLLAWLRHNPMVLERDPVSFTIGVSAKALSDPELPAALAGALSSTALEPGMIGFELREAACINHYSLAEDFIAQCERSRCFVVIDDFTFNTAILELLRSSAAT